MSGIMGEEMSLMEAKSSYHVCRVSCERVGACIAASFGIEGRSRLETKNFRISNFLLISFFLLLSNYGE